MIFRRVLRAILVLGIGLLVIALGGVGWLTATESGARFLLNRVVAASNGAFEYDSISGRLTGDLRLTGLRYRDAAQELALDELELRFDLGQILSRRLVIDTLMASEVSFHPLQQVPTAASSTSALPLPELPLTIQVSRSSIAGIRVERDGAAPVAIERIILSAAAAGTSARVQRFEFWLQGFFISMQGSVGWDDGFSVDGIVSWDGDVEDSVLLGNAQIAGRWPSFVFEQKTIEPIEQSAVGRVTLGASPTFELVIEQPAVGGASLSGTYTPASRTWQARIDAEGLAPGAFIPGWPGQLDVSGDVTAQQGEPWRLAVDELVLAATLDDDVLTAELDGTIQGLDVLAIDRAAVAFGANSVELSGTIDTSLDLALTAELDDLAAIERFLARDDIRRLLPELPPIELLSGRALLDLAISGPRETPTVAGEISLDGSRYADLPLAVRARFASPAAPADTIRFERFEATLGASSVRGSGSVGAGILGSDPALRQQAPLALDLQLAAGDLAQLAALPLLDVELPELAGRGDARIQLAGSFDEPMVTTDIALTGLRYGDVIVDDASLAGRFGLYAGADARFAITATAPDWDVSLGATGVLTEDRWAGTVTSLSLEEPWLGSWNLESPVTVELAPALVQVSNACLVHADSGLCVEWSTGGRDERIRVVADDFDLGVLAPLLPPTLALRGRVSLDAALDSPRATPRGTLTASGTDIGVDVAVSETDRIETVFETVALEAALANAALGVRADVRSRTGGEARLILATTDVRDSNAAVSGTLDILWQDLSSLSLLSPDVGEVGGTLAVSVVVTGTAADPEPSGSATISGGHVAVPQWGILINNIEGEAFSDTGSTLEYVGSGVVENSVVRLSGVTEIDPAAGWPTRLRLTGDYVPVAHRPDATVYASPSLDIVVDLPSIDVSGRVVIPEADIAIEALPVQAVKVSPDSVVHGLAEQEPIRPLAVTADVTVELGDSVRYSGSNLDTALAGALRLQYQSGLTPTASGGVSLTGAYDAYGQALALERGELLFAGPLDDPALDVLAVREIGTVRVGVRLSGTLRAPVTSMYSDPPMSELNALSYLRFGRPLTSSDGGETVTLESTALALGLEQALPAVQRVGDALQLDEFGIEPTEVDAGSLMAGKYLSPKVYLSYTYGLFNRLGGFLLRYQINDRFSLETRSGNEKSMDFLYSVEKD